MTKKEHVANWHARRRPHKAAVAKRWRSLHTAISAIRPRVDTFEEAVKQWKRVSRAVAALETAVANDYRDSSPWDQNESPAAVALHRANEYIRKEIEALENCDQQEFDRYIPTANTYLQAAHAAFTQTARR